MIEVAGATGDCEAGDAAGSGVDGAAAPKGGAVNTPDEPDTLDVLDEFDEIDPVGVDEAAAPVPVVLLVARLRWEKGLKDFAAVVREAARRLQKELEHEADQGHRRREHHAENSTEVHVRRGRKCSLPGEGGIPRGSASAAGCRRLEDRAGARAMASEARPSSQKSREPLPRYFRTVVVGDGPAREKLAALLPSVSTSFAGMLTGEARASVVVVGVVFVVVVA